MFSESKIIQRNYDRDIKLIERFKLLDTQNMQKIDILINVEEDDEFQQRLTILQTKFAQSPDLLSSHEHDELPRLSATNQLKNMFRALYIKMRSNKFNIRSILSQSELQDKMEEYVRADRAALEEKTRLDAEEEKEKLEKRLRQEGKKKIKAPRVRTNEHTHHLNVFSKAYIRDETKLELDVDYLYTKISQLGKKNFKFTTTNRFVKRTSNCRCRFT